MKDHRKERAEARKKAEQEVYEPSLCWQCAKEIEVDAVGDVVSVERSE